MTEKIPYFKPEIRKNILLSSPEQVTSDQLAKAERSHASTFGMGPQQNSERSYKLIYHNGKAGIDAKFYGKLPDIISTEQRKLFTETEETVNGTKTKVYSCFFGDLKKTDLDSGDETPSGEYLIAQPRIFEDQKPATIETQQLINLLKHKRLLFYTGAGISTEKGLSMEDMLNALGIKNEKSFQKKIIETPEIILEAIKKFHQIAYEATPTAAHKALAKIANANHGQILTENFDFLQERAGVEPYHMSGPRIQAEVHPEWLKQVDAILCIGLSQDDRGFLAWYKANNPKGKIIAIDKKQPKYLGNEDYFLPGDLQKLLPEIAQNI